MTLTPRKEFSPHMKIAVNTRLLQKGRLEGIGWFTHEVLLRLVQRHPEHEFWFLFDRPYDREFVFADNVKPLVVGPPARHPLLFYWWFEWRVPTVLQRIGSDVFLSPDNFLSLRSRVPTVLVTHDLAPAHFPEHLTPMQRWYYRHFQPKFNHRADQIVAVSEYTRQDIIRTYGVDGDKIRVACNGCRASFRPLNALEIEAVRRDYSEGKPYFLYVGSVHPRKNVARLIEAYGLFRRQTGADVLLVICGRFAWNAHDARRAWEQSPYKQDIRFVGYLDTEELARLTGAAFASVYVSLFEGFGVPLLEAMNCGVPLICSDLSSMPEVTGDAALQVSPYEVEHISSAMQRLWADEHLRRRLRAAGLERSRIFTWEKAATVVYEAIEAAACQRTSVQPERVVKN